MVNRPLLMLISSNYPAVSSWAIARVAKRKESPSSLPLANRCCLPQATTPRRIHLDWVLSSTLPCCSLQLVEQGKKAHPMMSKPQIALVADQSHIVKWTVPQNPP